MKIEYLNKKIIVYLYRYLLNYDDLTLLNKELKILFQKLIRVYHVDLSGYLVVHLYENKNYGCILEIIKKSELFMENTIDLKVIVYRNVSFYLVMDDYLFDDINNYIFYKNNKYYLSVDKIDNIMHYIELGKITYHIDKE